jgi:hypothetical protein
MFSSAMLAVMFLISTLAPSSSSTSPLPPLIADARAPPTTTKIRPFRKNDRRVSAAPFVPRAGGSTAAAHHPASRQRRISNNVGRRCSPTPAAAASVVSTVVVESIGILRGGQRVGYGGDDDDDYHDRSFYDSGDNDRRHPPPSSRPSTRQGRGGGGSDAPEYEDAYTSRRGRDHSSGYYEDYNDVGDDYYDDRGMSSVRMHE